MKYKFTVFTPCYNSEKFLHRVYDSLLNQTFKDFEWLVINDASTDNTSELITDYIKKAPFDIQFFDLKKNQMLTKNYNLAVRNAKGEFFVPIGHDDEILPNALEFFIKNWEKYGDDKYSGISCLCEDQFGNIVGDKYPESPMISNYIDIMYNYKIEGEKWGFIRTAVMKEFIQNENIDVYLGEGHMWKEMAEKYSIVYFNIVLRKYYIHQDHASLSATSDKKIRYPKGDRFNYLEMINRYHKKINGSYIFKLTNYINYVRMSFHSNTKPGKIIKDVHLITDKTLIITFLVFGYYFYKKDIMQGRKAYLFA